MDEKDPHSTVRRSEDQPTPATRPTILWRMRSATYDNEASCLVSEPGGDGCDMLVVFTKGLGVPEHFDDIGDAVRHSMEIAGRLTVQGWVEIDLSDR